MQNDPTSQLSEKFLQQKAEINRLYRGHARKARLMIADLTYGLGLIEGNLGADSVRENWRAHIDKLTTCTQTEETRTRRHVLMAIDWAARAYLESNLASKWKNPRRIERTFFAKDRSGVDTYLISAWPHENEAAAEGIAFLERFDPELAARLSVSEIATLLPLWISRKENVGRRGRKVAIDEALCALFDSLGYGKIEREAMRRFRLAFERDYPCHQAGD